jgi:3-hydroxybutyryl-CoA dehydrogenase
MTEHDLTVAIIGAGPAGRWLALRAARAGFRVFLEDVLPGNLRQAQESLRRELEAKATGRELGKITFVSTIEDAVRSAGLVVDCVPDELESKLEILWLLDRMAPPGAVFVTPTKQLSIADLSACTYRPAQCIAVAVEPRALARFKTDAAIPLRAGPVTSAETIALVRGFWKRLGSETTLEAPPAG